MATDETAVSVTETALPAESIARAWREVGRVWWQATLAVLPAFLMTRLVFLLLTYFGGVLFTLPNYAPFPLTANGVLYSWYHWDATRYLAIAGQGYLDSSYTPYFPLYPALVHAVGALFHRDLLLTAMLVSNLAFLGALVVFYRLMEREGLDGETARRAVLYLAIFPTALFCFAASAEPLFLLFMLLCFYALRHSQWWLAGLFGALAALTYSVGILLFVVFLCEFLRQHALSLRQARGERQPLRYWLQFSGILASLLIPLGLAIYLYALHRQFQDAFAFLHPQSNASFSLPWQAPLAAIASLLKVSPFTFIVTHSLFQLLIFVFVLALLVLACVGTQRFTREQWPFVLFTVLVLVYTLSFPDLPNAQRSLYDPLPALLHNVLFLFPCFMILARLGRRAWLHQGYFLLSLPLLSFLVLQLLTGHWTI